MSFIYLLTVYGIIYRRGRIPPLWIRGMESKRRRVPRGGERNASEPGCQSGCSVRRFFPFRGLEQRVGAGLSLTLAEPRAAGLSCTDSALGLNLTAGWRRLRSECGGLGRKEEETSEGTTDARRQHLPARVSLSRGPESPSSKPRTRGCRGARAPRRRCCRGRAEGDGATAGICTRSGWLAGETARRKVRYPSRLQCRAVRTRCFLRVLPWPLICLSPGAAPRIANCPKVSFSGDQNREGCRALGGVDLRTWGLLCQKSTVISRPRGCCLF